MKVLLTICLLVLTSCNDAIVPPLCDPFPGGLKCKPNWLLIGSAKSSTTTYWSVLMRHPRLAGPQPVDPQTGRKIPKRGKEPHFFDEDAFEHPPHASIEWYESIFPESRPNDPSRLILGEATAYYLFFPEVAPQVAQTLPNARFLVSLRDPVERAHSHFWYRPLSERRSWESVVNEEYKLLQKYHMQHSQKAQFRMMKSPGSLVREHGNLDNVHHTPLYFELFTLTTEPLGRAFLSQSMYFLQFELWLNYFPIDRFLVSEPKQYSNQSFYDQVFAFIGVPSHQLSALGKKKMNKNPHPSQNSVTCQTLRKFFEPYNQALYSLLDHDFNWESNQCV